MKKTINILLFFFLFANISCAENRTNVVVDAQNITEYKYVPSKFNNLRIYQVMVESYIDGDPERNYNDGYGTSHHKGDLKGITIALPYIKNLGMNAVWLTPIFDSEKGTPSYSPDNSPNIKLDATGYFTRNYFKIDPNFGTLQDAKDLVKKAHELGLYVFLDGVFGHHKGNVTSSPNGNKPVGDRRHVKYPESLEFFKEVAAYWIDKLEIDGWRLDQAYQIPTSCLNELKNAVSIKCALRKKAGRKWGTLGYMVGEVWKTSDIIAKKAFGTEDEPGLISAFDFPVRYKLIQVLAVEEKGFGKQPVSVLKEGFMTHLKYPYFAVPNLMLTNHDLVRFGDLLERAGYGGKENENYWKRHKCALSFLAAYTGPVTIYYGDEYGDEVEGFAEKITDPEEKCWEKGLCDDHVSRNSGKISGFSEKQKDLQKYFSSLMKLRKENPALWNGKTTNLIAENGIYADIKFFQEKEEIFLYVLNASTETKSITIPESAIDGNKITNVISDETIKPHDKNFTIKMEPLNAVFFKIEK